MLIAVLCHQWTGHNEHVFFSTKEFISTPSMETPWNYSLIDFCIVSVNLFFILSDVRVKRGVELSTDYHLVVCTLKALLPLRKQKTFRPQKTY